MEALPARGLLVHTEAFYVTVVGNGPGKSPGKVLPGIRSLQPSRNPPQIPQVREERLTDVKCINRLFPCCDLQGERACFGSQLEEVQSVVMGKAPPESAAACGSKRLFVHISADQGREWERVDFSACFSPFLFILESYFVG